MRYTWIVLGVLGVLGQGCARASAPQAEVPTLQATAEEEQLDALVIDQRPMVAEVGECPFEQSEVPPLSTFDDSRLPEFDASRDRASNHHSGEERLDDTVLYQSMLPLQDEIFRCLDIAACYAPEGIGAGELDFQLELGANGKVRAATVRPSDALDVGPVVSCARMAVAQLEFPKYDGGNMIVSYQMSIE